eukprot:GEMP01012876.1.p1 GENE.GEMP01012876.1~~GEMP01012876.1.p1  ORF type:complete len:518 (+),score=166.63 GEMP01012876.1:267-1820(+)
MTLASACVDNNMEYLCTKYRDLLDTVKEEKTRNARLAESEKHLSERVEELEKQHARDQAMLEMKTEKVQDEQRKSLKARGSMQHSLTCVKKRQSELESQVEEGNRLRKALEGKLVQLQDELREALERNQAREETPKTSRMTCPETSQARRDVTRRELTYARESVGEARGKLKAAENIIDEQHWKLWALNEEKDRAVKQLRTTLRTCGDLRLTLESESSVALKQEQRASQLDSRLKSVRAAKRATEGLVDSLAKNVDQVHGQFGAMSALRMENQRLSEQLRLETQRRFRGVGAKEQATLLVERLQEQVQSLEGQVDRKRVELDLMSDELAEARAECYKWESKAKSAQNSESPRLREENKAQAAQIKNLENVIEEMKGNVEELQKKLYQKEMVAVKHARKSAQSAKSLAEAEKRLTMEQRRSEISSVKYTNGFTSPPRYAGGSASRVPGAARRSGDGTRTLQSAERMTLSTAFEDDFPRPVPTEAPLPEGLDAGAFEDLESLLRAEPAVLKVEQKSVDG